MNSPEEFLKRFQAPFPDPQPASFQMLFADLVDLSGPAMRAALRDQHPSLEAVESELWPVSALPPGVELAFGDGPDPGLVGWISWGEHVVKLLGFDSPMPSRVLEGCLQPALLPPEMKQDARRHRAHLLLYYSGQSRDPLEQRVALGLVAGALSHFGAMLTLNEEARAAVPSFAFLPEEAEEDILTTLRQLPLPYFYAGFVRMELTDIAGVWIRTFAAHRFGLPEIAYRAREHGEGEQVFHLFAGVLGYLRQTGLAFEVDEIIKIDDDTHLRVREPALLEWWLDTPGKLWVIEKVNLQ